MFFFSSTDFFFSFFSRFSLFPNATFEVRQRKRVSIQDSTRNYARRYPDDRGEERKSDWRRYVANYLIARLGIVTGGVGRGRRRQLIIISPPWLISRVGGHLTKVRRTRFEW